MHNTYTFKNSVTGKEKKANSSLLKLMPTICTEDITEDKKEGISYKGRNREMLAEKRAGKIY